MWFFLMERLLVELNLDRGTDKMQGVITHIVLSTGILREQDRKLTQIISCEDGSDYFNLYRLELKKSQF